MIETGKLPARLCGTTHIVRRMRRMRNVSAGHLLSLTSLSSQQGRRIASPLQLLKGCVEWIKPASHPPRIARRAQPCRPLPHPLAGSTERPLVEYSVELVWPDITSPLNMWPRGQFTTGRNQYVFYGVFKIIVFSQFLRRVTSWFSSREDRPLILNAAAMRLTLTRKEAEEVPVQTALIPNRLAVSSKYTSPN